MNIPSGKSLSKTIDCQTIRDGQFYNSGIIFLAFFGHAGDEARQRPRKAFAEFSTDSLYRDPAGRGFLLRAGNSTDCFINLDHRMKDLLNPYSVEFAGIALRTFEENLRQAQEWPDGKEEHSRLYQSKLVPRADSRKRTQARHQ